MYDIPSGSTQGWVYLAPNGELVMLMIGGNLLIQELTLDSIPPWSTLSKLQALANHYIHQACYILPSPNTKLLVDTNNGSLKLNPLDTNVIKCNILKDRTCLLEFFRGINFDVIVVLQFCI